MADLPLPFSHLAIDFKVLHTELWDGILWFFVQYLCATNAKSSVTQFRKGLESMSHLVQQSMNYFIRKLCVKCTA